MLEVGGRQIRLSSPDRELWPGFTKHDLLRYYLDIAPVLLPHLAGRAVTLGRFPRGVLEPGFAQTECRGQPEWLPTRAVRLRSGEIRHYCLIEEPAAMAWLANLSTLELHPFLHREDPDRPDFLVFDLDPGAGAGLRDCCELALLLREELSSEGLIAAAKTSGGDGLHVYARATSGPYEETRRLSRAIAAKLAARHPRLAVDRMDKELRSGRVLIDWAQNHGSRSTVAPYSPRAAARPWVSTPVSWQEIERDDPEELRFLPGEVLDRVGSAGDLFAAVLPEPAARATGTRSGS